MKKSELKELVEKLIWIRDNYNLLRSDKDALAYACNVIYNNIDKLSESDEGGMNG
jgi:hypothetical protein